MDLKDKALVKHLSIYILLVHSAFRLGEAGVNEERIRRQVESTALWPGDIFYTISNVLTGHDKPMEAIASAIAHWEEHSCVRFIYIPEHELAYSGIVGEQQYISFNGSLECSSPVGMYAGRGPHIIKISSDCAHTGMLIHEIGHALGMWHEHSRSDRDAHVLVMWNNIKSGNKHNFNRQSHSKLIVPYDLESIMHYDRKMFSENGENTLETLDHRLAYIVGRHQVLSHYDAMTANLLYKCAGNCGPHFACENDGYLTSECTCKCPKGLTGERCEDVDTHSGCGGVIHVIKGDVIVTSPNFPAPYRNNMKCVWLLKGPPHTLLQLRITDIDIEKSHIRGCRDELEVRYHSIGVSKGHVTCGQNEDKKSFDSVDNKMMLRFESDEDISGQGFKAMVSVRPEQDCRSSPCQNRAECEDVASIKTYVCQCPRGWVGKNCEIPIVDGKLSQWSSWSPCESKCGLKSRFRTCTDPAPMNGGKDCTGMTYSTRQCHEDKHCKSYFSCDFGSSRYGSSCGMTQNDPAAALEWLTASGETPSQRTGPPGGHTTGDENDQYLYLEASIGKLNQKAIAWIPQMKLRPAMYCMEFFYNLHGSHIGTLSVLQKLQYKPGTYETLWQRSGEQGSNWMKAMVNVILHQNMQIGFMAMRGETYQGDIAIDDISLSPGVCQPITKKTRKGCRVGKKRAKQGNFTKKRGCSTHLCFCNQDGYVDCPAWGKEYDCKGSKLPKKSKHRDWKQYGYKNQKRRPWMQQRRSFGQ